MKKLVLILLLSLTAHLSKGQSLHGLNFQNINGVNVSLASFADKKILIFIAPILDTSALKEIKAFQALYGDSIKLIGVLSVEDGYVDSIKSNIQQSYLDAGIDIILTSGVYTKKNAGNNQSTLMKWLTDRSENKRFNIDADGIGQKFFVDEKGKLYSVLIPQVPFLSPPVLKNLDRKAKY